MKIPTSLFWKLVIPLPHCTDSLGPKGTQARSITGPSRERAEQRVPGPPQRKGPGPAGAAQTQALLPPQASARTLWVSHCSPTPNAWPHGSILKGDGEFSLSSASHSLDSLLALRKHSSLFSFYNKHILSSQYVQSPVLGFFILLFFSH